MIKGACDWLNKADIESPKNFEQVLAMDIEPLQRNNLSFNNEQAVSNNSWVGSIIKHWNFSTDIFISAAAESKH